MQSFRLDLRLGVRLLVRNRGFTTAAVLILGLGVGVAASIFTVVHAVLLRSLPYQDPDRLLVVAGRQRGPAEEAVPLSYLDCVDYREQAAGVFSGLASHSNLHFFNLTTDGEPQRIGGEFVSPEYFELLGTAPELGRFFTGYMDSLADSYRVVVSHGLWREQFGADPDLVGSAIVLNGKSYEVLGITPRDFWGATDGAKLWLPLKMAATVLGPQFTDRRSFRWLSAVARLKPGVTLDRAQAAMDVVTARLEGQYPDSNQQIGARLEPLAEAWLGGLRGTLVLLLVGAGFVLAIVFADLACLLLIRAAARQREFALRTALGAGRRRLIRQLLTENSLLSLAGLVLGLMVARWSTQILVAISGAQFRQFVQITLDPAVVAVTLAATLVCTLGSGLIPAWALVRIDPSQHLKEGAKGSAGAGHQRAQNLLVVAQLALALLLLVGAGSTLQGYLRLRHTDLGFRPQELLTLRLDIKGKTYSETEALIRALLARIGSLPDVRSVALTGPDLPTDDWQGDRFAVEREPEVAGPDGGHLFLIHHVSPGYFATLGVPLLAGRDFTFEDNLYAAAVVVVSEELARRYWPGEDPIGKRLTLGRGGPRSLWFTVAGVAADVRHQGLAGSERPGPDLYFTMLQALPNRFSILNLLVRPARGSVLDLAPRLRSEVRDIAPDLPLFDLAAMEQRLARQAAQPRFQALVMGLFALLALLLAVVAVYGAIAFSVAQRSQEIGIRVAFGATSGRLVRKLVGRGAVLGLAGIALGLGVAMASSRLVASLVPGLGANDPLLLAGAAILLWAVALAASSIPAWRATRIEPTVVLRSE